MHFTHIFGCTYVAILTLPSSLPSALPSCSHLDLISVAVHICEQGKEGGREGLHGHFIMHLSSRKPAPPLVLGIDLKPPSLIGIEMDQYLCLVLANRLPNVLIRSMK